MPKSYIPSTFIQVQAGGITTKEGIKRREDYTAQQAVDRVSSRNGDYAMIVVDVAKDKKVAIVASDACVCVDYVPEAHKEMEHKFARLGGLRLEKEAPEEDGTVLMYIPGSPCRWYKINNTWV